MSADGSGPIPDDLLYDEEELARIDGWTGTEPVEEPGTSIARLARTRASGAVIAAMMTRLGEILEGRPVGDEVAIVQAQDDDEPERPDGVRLEFDPESPAATRAVVRRTPD